MYIYSVNENSRKGVVSAETNGLIRTEYYGGIGILQPRA